MNEDDILWAECSCGNRISWSTEQLEYIEQAVYRRVRDALLEFFGHHENIASSLNEALGRIDPTDVTHTLRHCAGHIDELFSKGGQFEVEGEE